MFILGLFLGFNLTYLGILKFNMKKKKKTAYEEATLHLTPKEKERAEKQIGKEKIMQIDEVLKTAFSKINVYK